MADFWIVSGYKFQHQLSLAAAEMERARLQEKCPKQIFRVYRCKSHLNPTGAYRDVLAALQEMVSCFDTQAEPMDYEVAAINNARAAIAKAEGVSPEPTQADEFPGGPK